jgi:hypothetical protein
MSYKPIHNYRQRDKLPPNDPGKIIYGSHLSDDFEAISEAISSLDSKVENGGSSGLPSGDGYDDTQIKSDLATETNARIAGDANLQEQIDNLPSGGGDGYDDTELRADLAQEIDDRIAGDADLQTQIDALGAGGGGGAESLNDLSDVDLTTPPSDGDQLIFNAVLQKWVAGEYKPFPSEMPDLIPGEEGWTGDTDILESTGSLGFKIDGTDYVTGPATINAGNVLSLYWLGDPDSGEHIDCPDGTYISGSIRAEIAGGSKSYHTYVDKNPDVDFQDVQDVEANAVIESEIVTVSGTNSYCYFAGSSDSTSFEYKKNNDAWANVVTRASVYFEAGDDLQLRHTSGDEGATVTSTVTIGEKTITWSTTSIVSGIVTPTIEAPENDSIDISQTPTLLSSTYEAIGSTPNHASSDWQVMDENGDVIYESLNNTSDLESHKVDQKLDTATVYRCRVRYRATDGRESEWSPIVTFTTTDLIPGQYVWKSGNTSWTVPAGCYSLTLANVGNGGPGNMGTDTQHNGVYSGGGGALKWLNDYPVEPGDVLSLRGGVITFADGKTFALNSAVNNTAGAPSGLLDGGQMGGNGCAKSDPSPTWDCAGGGGAGGYTGRGGGGGRVWSSTCYVGRPGGGGGAGGGGSCGYSKNWRTRGGGGGGGSTFLYGQGNNGGGGQKGPWKSSDAGTNGINYLAGEQRGGNGSAKGSAGGGGGAAAPHFDSGGSPHGSGAGWCVRFVWPGDESRGHFPAAVEDV